MIQRIEEQDGHMFLHFGEPPADVGKIEFVIALRINKTGYSSANGVIIISG